MINCENPYVVHAVIKGDIDPDLVYKSMGLTLDL